MVELPRNCLDFITKIKFNCFQIDDINAVMSKIHFIIHIFFYYDYIHNNEELNEKGFCLKSSNLIKALVIHFHFRFYLPFLFR